MNDADLAKAQERNMVIAFIDLDGFGKIAKEKSDKYVMDFLSEYYEFVGDIVEQDGGIVVKFMFDGALIAYSGEKYCSAVKSLRRLKESGDSWLTDRGVSCAHTVKVHKGPVMCGNLGTRTDKRFDMLGKSVEIAARLPNGGFAVSDDLQSQLDEEAH